jgi:hypothetical protein
MINPVELTDPERKLWANVLLQAVTDLNGRDLVARSARAWFRSNENSVGSLIWICHQMSLDPDAVRRRVLSGAAKPQALETDRAA